MSFFDDIEDEITSDSREMAVEIVMTSCMNDEIKILEQQLNPVEYSDVAIYNSFTSAEFHKRIGRLFADTQTLGVSQTVIRWGELESLLNVKLPTNQMENFAADYGDLIIYLHMDNGSYEHKDIHFNYFRYNDPSKGVMEFFDMNNEGKLIEDNKWKDRLGKKLILVFGYAPRLNSNIPEPLIFLGSHRGPVYSTNEDESFELSLSNTESLSFIKASIK